MIIQSSTSLVSASIEAIQSFVRNPRNLDKLLPADKISQFEATDTRCSFVVQGGIKINLILEESTDSNVCYRSGEGSPFPFTLKIFLNQEGDQTAGFVVFDGEINGFLKMMVEKPLKSLFEGMIERMKAHV
ncbi:MAG: hypothetical protein RLZZ30_494 [Bacteroidota bacterium]|jgi:carbon monoxide dehydrogenase subunit G